jgi:hypothetical protein
MLFAAMHEPAWHVWDMPTDAGNVCFLGYFGSPVSGSSGPVLTDSVEKVARDYRRIMIPFR